MNAMLTVAGEGSLCGMVGVLSPLEALREYCLDGKGVSKRKRLAHL